MLVVTHLPAATSDRLAVAKRPANQLADAKHPRLIAVLPSPLAVLPSRLAVPLARLAATQNRLAVVKWLVRLAVAKHPHATPVAAILVQRSVTAACCRSSSLTRDVDVDAVATADVTRLANQLAAAKLLVAVLLSRPAVAKLRLAAASPHAAAKLRLRPAAAKLPLATAAVILVPKRAVAF